MRNVNECVSGTITACAVKFGLVSRNFLHKTIRIAILFQNTESTKHRHYCGLTKFKPVDILLDFVSAQLTAHAPSIFSYRAPFFPFEYELTLLLSEGIMALPFSTQKLDTLKLG